MDPEIKSSLKSFLIEFFLYAALVFAYYFLVLRFLGGWLERLFASDRKFYAAIALLLIVCQGVLLETLTRFLLSFIKPHTEGR